MPFQLCYASTATQDFSRGELLELLTYARKHNAEKSITGLLLFQGGHFLQVLEGEPNVVRELFKQICKDQRHTDIALLFEELVSHSQYPDWSMGFQALDGNEWMEFPKEDSEQQDLRALAQTMGRAKELLMYVRKQGLDPTKDIG
ncbi:MAG: BLUF domain-containing protein [Lamprobacter sp.]|uniref:BLUF domain-containing protein n=1 Tax=Lamprobacter sp. TaxID=3100796 RepID=UPI002B25A4B3|nr:BLUF domain-containing protein [Lamprobacter sp.]MEA3641021.1 BLUF domain-containing protein [Lamprobacter sp.]